MCITNRILQYLRYDCCNTENTTRNLKYEFEINLNSRKQLLTHNLDIISFDELTTTITVLFARYLYYYLKSRRMANRTTCSTARLSSRRIDLRFADRWATK